MISHHLCSERVSVPTPMVSYYHQVYSHTVFSLTHSPIHVIPVNTSMVSYYHQVYSHTHCSERTCAPTHTSMVSYYHQVITHPHQSLCSHSLHFNSFSLQMHHKCITNASPTISHTLPPIMPPSHHHHFLSPITTYHHQSLPLTPHNTPNPSISIPTLPIVS